MAPQFKDLSEHALHEKLMEYREQFRRGQRFGEEVLLPALAAVREVSDRKLGLRPFLVQLIGALALHRGYLAEMATGEGKTLTAGLTAVFAGWTKLPCHIITVNDYLVKRDAEWLAPLYHFCGVRVGHVTATMPPPERQKGYGCDVTYATSKEMLADFLRDRLQLGQIDHPTRRLIRRMLAPRLATREGLVLRGLHTAIVDEADSVLIDEAVTPLIISAGHKNESMRDAVMKAQELVSQMQPGVDYQVNARYREIEITKAGRRKLADICSVLPGLWHGESRREELVRQALVARDFFHPGKQYILLEEKVVIVDEFTGRPMPQRTWREGLHQAIEAKEGLEISDPTETIARLSFQRFFRCFHKLSGMTGTAREAATEFWQIYRLPVVTIPTNRPCIRVHRPDRVFLTETDKWADLVRDVESIHAQGQPLLIGTRSVAASEHVAGLLRDRGLSFHLLNARHPEEEAAIVANAGELGKITIATNMAGRGTDILLGKGVVDLGGLHVIATERHESGRVDRQLFGRSARQGDPGSAQAFVSAKDELIRRYLPMSLQRTLQHSLASGLPGREQVAKSTFDLAQRRAQRLAYKQRQTVLRTDTWMEEALSFAGNTV
jgi:preprotein translocase subunit SecA